LSHTFRPFAFSIKISGAGLVVSGIQVGALGILPPIAPLIFYFLIHRVLASVSEKSRSEVLFRKPSHTKQNTLQSTD
jgi:hypothetical protein